MSPPSREPPVTNVGAYRDGFAAAVQVHDARRRSVLARAETLGPEARRELPKAWRRMLSDSESRLCGSPSTVAELATAERALDAYERQVEDALSLVPDLRKQRIEGSLWRRVQWWHVFAVAAVGVVAATGVIARKRSEDARRAIAACRMAAACSSRGECSLSVTGSCTAATNADCASSEACAIDGKCSADDGACHARFIDCMPSRVCVEQGRCVARAGECVASDDDFEYYEGACLAQPRGCRAYSERDCEQSDGCRERGACFLENHRCVPPHVPTEPADAEMKAFACDAGECVEFDGHVVAAADLPCLRSSGCTTSGLCSMIEGQCVVREPWQCQRSVNCAWAGACSIDGPDPQAKPVARRCVARTPQDCAKTPGCLADSRCFPSHGHCVGNEHHSL